MTFLQRSCSKFVEMVIEIHIYLLHNRHPCVGRGLVSGIKPLQLDSRLRGNDGVTQHVYCIGLLFTAIVCCIEKVKMKNGKPKLREVERDSYRDL